MDQTSANNVPTHDVQVLVNGQYVYKTTILNGLFRPIPVSTERLCRTKGISNEACRAYDDSPELEDCLF